MTPTFCWVFLLALVGCAASMPKPLVVDACALLCNPGAETESEQARDPILYPRYPKVDCKLQSDAEDHQAWVIASNCFKLCNRNLSVELEVNCYALRSSLEAHLGCYCDALTPLSPNTMKLHETWRLNFLVKELAKDILDTIVNSPLDKIILCEIHQELFQNMQFKTQDGKLTECFKNTSTKPTNSKELNNSEPEPDTPEPDISEQISEPKAEALHMEEWKDMHDKHLLKFKENLERIKKEESIKDKIKEDEVNEKDENEKDEVKIETDSTVQESFIKENERKEEMLHFKTTLKPEEDHKFQNIKEAKPTKDEIKIKDIVTDSMLKRFLEEKSIKDDKEDEEAMKTRYTQPKKEKLNLNFRLMCNICNDFCKSDNSNSELELFCNCKLIQEKCNLEG